MRSNKKIAENRYLISQRKLEILDNYYKWAIHFAQFKNGTCIWDASAGIGHLAVYLKNISRKIIMTEFSDENINILKKRFKGDKYIVRKCDLRAININLYKKDKIDVIVCLDVLEHIEQDDAVIDSFYSILNDNGFLVVKVPAHQFLFSYMDENVYHYRCYSKNLMVKRLKEAGFHVEKAKYINMVGAIVYYFKGKFSAKRSSFSSSFSNSFLYFINLIIPIIIKIEDILPTFFGLSLVVIARKND